MERREDVNLSTLRRYVEALGGELHVLPRRGAGSIPLSRKVRWIVERATSGDPLAVPSKDGLRRRERRDLGEPLSAEWSSLLGEQPSLGMGEPEALVAEPGAKHAVLGAQVLDGLGFLATKPAGDQQNEELKRNGRRHGRPTLAHTGSTR
jgi:hypothetical protein